MMDQERQRIEPAAGNMQFYGGTLAERPKRITRRLPDGLEDVYLEIRIVMDRSRDMPRTLMAEARGEQRLAIENLLAGRPLEAGAFVIVGGVPIRHRSTYTLDVRIFSRDTTYGFSLLDWDYLRKEKNFENATRTSQIQSDR
jgi:hypothetical protein